MVVVAKDRMEEIAPLFAGMEDTLILSCLQGEMGVAWADALPGPRCARIVLGDFCFLAGDAEAPGAAELATMPEGKRFLIVIPQGEAWHPLVEAAFPGQCRRSERYALKKEPGVFQREKLTELATRLPEGYTLELLGEAWYRETKAQAWARDFTSQFDSWQHYARRGLGVVAVKDGEMAGGASSYSCYRGGIEIEIVVEQHHRRKGLATACGARLILECLDRGLYPSWDAANRESWHLAQNLGYHPGEPYPAYFVDLGGSAE